MLGTFSPRKEPYAYELEEETTPSGYFARGSYYAKTKVELIDHIFFSFLLPYNLMNRS